LVRKPLREELDVVAGRKKGDTRIDDPGESKNAELLAIQSAIQGLTQKQLGDMVGLSRKQVNVRLKRLARKLVQADDITVAAELLRGAVPLCAAVVLERVASGDYQAAKDVLQTHGVMVQRTETVNRNIPATVDELDNAIKALGTEDYEKLRERFNTRG
jgi:hypothetical protein